jgi:hypothetical protein
MLYLRRRWWVSVFILNPMNIIDKKTEVQMKEFILRDFEEMQKAMIGLEDDHIHILFVEETHNKLFPY